MINLSKIKEYVKNIKKSHILLIAVLLFSFVGAAGVTSAFFTDKTEGVVNTFVPGELEIEQTEVFNNNIKTNVGAKNTGDIDVFVRIKLVGNWYQTVDGEERLVGKNNWSVPKEVLKLEQDWFDGNDGYYYYKEKLKTGETTDTYLIDSITLKLDEDGTYQGLDVIVEAIQADGVTDAEVPAVTDAWGIAVNNGILQKPSTT